MNKKVQYEDNHKIKKNEEEMKSLLSWKNKRMFEYCNNILHLN